VSQPLDTAALWAQIADRTGREPLANFMAMPGLRVSYADLAGAVGAWLAWFDAIGLGPGQRLVIRTADEWAAVSAFIAGLLDGVVPVLLTGDTPDLRLAAIITATQPDALVVDAASLPADLPAGLPVLGLRAADVPAGRGWFVRQARPRLPGGLPPALTSRPPRLPASDDGLAYILFTSGTTSAPTGVQITRANLFANLATQTRLFAFGRDTRIFNDMVLAHADGLIQGPVQALVAGGALIRSGGFSLPGIEAWLARVRTERATHVITVPTVWALIDRYAAHDDYFDAPECRLLMSCAAHLPPDLWQRLEARFALPLCNQYGLTETVVTSLWAGSHPEMGRAGTIGKPVDGQARVADAGPDGAGELQLHGANVFPGYWRNPERTAASFTPDGWLKTGDIARQEADGSFTYLGRSKTVIMAGGFLIRPDEIDEAMLRHPALRESVTVGIEDETFGEVPATAVVADRRVDEAELAAHARQHLEASKVPKRIVQVAEIARGPSGKPLLAPLRALLVETFGRAAAADPGTEVKDTVIAVAADLFRVDPTLLDLTARQGSVAGWDSFSHLNLVMAVEQHFGVTIPASRVAAIATLGDIVRTVADLRR